MNEQNSEKDIDGVDRRSFLKRVGLVGAFAVPLITTFSMSSVDDAFGAPLKKPAPPMPNGFIGNQSSGKGGHNGFNGYYGNQGTGSGNPHSF